MFSSAAVGVLTRSLFWAAALELALLFAYATFVPLRPLNAFEEAAKIRTNSQWTQSECQAVRRVEDKEPGGYLETKLPESPLLVLGIVALLLLVGAMGLSPLMEPIKAAALPEWVTAFLPLVTGKLAVPWLPQVFALVLATLIWGTTDYSRMQAWRRRQRTKLLEALEVHAPRDAIGQSGSSSSRQIVTS